MKPLKPIDQKFSYFAVVHAPRRPHLTTLHSLEATITITIRATICGAHHWVEIEQWGHAHHPWLSACLDLQLGIPSHDTFGCVFAVPEPTKLQQVNLQGRVVPLDVMGCQSRSRVRSLPKVVTTC